MNPIIPLKELPLSNDFMFSQVMRNEDICILFLEALLQKDIKHIVFIDKQKDLSDSYTSHGIRLDVYINDENGTVYNIEMQNSSRRVLERRCRYYQSGMDRHLLEKNADYDELGETYIIFVCNFDYFRRGLAVYERESKFKGCEDLIYDDGSHVLFLNSHYRKGNADHAILEFLDYVRTNNETESHSDLMEKVKTAVQSVRNDETKEESYMTWEMSMRDARKEAKEEGRAEERANNIRLLKNDLSPEILAKRFNMSLEEIKEILRS